MTVESISEAQFLLTELRYTLGQLHVQVLDLDAETRSQDLCEGRSVDGILAEMLDDEREHQRRYSELLGVSAGAAPESNPLPVYETDAPPTLETRFEHERAKTIGILEHGGDSWSQELLDAVKAQVQKDRERTTQIAECRKAFFEADQRPDLNEPITTEPAPHVEST